MTEEVRIELVGGKHEVRLYSLDEAIAALNALERDNAALRAALERIAKNETRGSEPGMRPVDMPRNRQQLARDARDALAAPPEATP